MWLLGALGHVRLILVSRLRLSATPLVIYASNRLTGLCVAPRLVYVLPWPRRLRTLVPRKQFLQIGTLK